jgi:hypothetical protein
MVLVRTTVRARAHANAIEREDKRVGADAVQPLQFKLEELQQITIP